MTARSISTRHGLRVPQGCGIGLCISLLLSVSPASATLVQSTFDTDDEGWIAASINGATGQVNFITDVTYSNTGGNPGGRISISDLDMQSTFLGAPSPFLGDISWAYGGKFQFDHIDLTVGPGGSPLDNTPVGLAGNGRILVFLAPLAETTWQTRTVPMQEDAGWVDLFTGMPVTQSEFLGVLSDVQLFGIQAETREFFFDDVVGLDNVSLASVPEPSSLLLLAVATPLGMTLLRRRRRLRA